MYDRLLVTTPATVWTTRTMRPARCWRWTLTRPRHPPPGTKGRSLFRVADRGVVPTVAGQPATSSRTRTRSLVCSSIRSSRTI